MKSLAVCALVALAACASSSGANKSNAKTVAAKDLPADHARVLSAYSRGGAEWEAEREHVLTDPRLTTFVIENLTLELVKAQRALGGDDVEFRRAKNAWDRAFEELSRFGALAVPTLVAFLDVSDGVGASAVSEVLIEIGRPAVEGTSQLLTANDAESRRRAAAVLQDQPHGGSTVEPLVRKRLIECMAVETDWTVRTALARTIGARGSRDSDVVPWRNALQAGLLDEDPLVLEASAKGLVEIGDPRAVPVLIDVLERSERNGDFGRIQVVQDTLVRLSRQPAKNSVAEWRKWWASTQPQR